MFKQPNNQCKRRFNTGSVHTKFTLCELCFYLCSSDQKLVEASDSLLTLNVYCCWCSITMNDWLLLCVATLCGQSIVWLIVLSSGAYWCLLINLKKKKKHPHHNPCAFTQMTVMAIFCIKCSANALSEPQSFLPQTFWRLLLHRHNMCI